MPEYSQYQGRNCVILMITAAAESIDGYHCIRQQLTPTSSLLLVLGFASYLAPDSVRPAEGVFEERRRGT